MFASLCSRENFRLEATNKCTINNYHVFVNNNFYSLLSVYSSITFRDEKDKPIVFKVDKMAFNKCLILGQFEQNLALL